MLNKNEKLLSEAIDTMLQHDAKLGLAFHDNKKSSGHQSGDGADRDGESERGYQQLHGQITEMFALKAAESPFHDSFCQAFSKVHNYKYIDDPTFAIAMEKELLAQGIPLEERNKALDIVPTIINELKEEQKEWSEQNFGFNPNLSQMRDGGNTVHKFE